MVGSGFWSFGILVIRDFGRFGILVIRDFGYSGFWLFGILVDSGFWLFGILVILDFGIRDYGPEPIIEVFVKFKFDYSKGSTEAA